MLEGRWIQQGGKYLIRRGTSYKWTSDCEKSFQAVKQAIMSDSTLAHFDPKLPLILATDASPCGLGAVISHRLPSGIERPISFASRSLTKSEERYSQIDKEATAIYWGLKKFYQYCYGRTFILQTDNKPLSAIFHPDKALPAISATRLFNYAHFLSGFDYKIEYRPTDQHSNADYLSRNPLHTTNPTHVDVHTTFQIQQIETISLHPETVAKETKKDPILRELVTALETGQDLEKLGLQNNEYTLQDGCVFKGHRLLVPTKLHRLVLDELHIGHMGMVKMKLLARSYCYWKGIDNDIEALVRNCRKCCLKRNEPPKVELHPWETPSGPWQRIHIDFAGPMNNEFYFIVVDAFSKWVEVIPTRVTSASWCLRQLRRLFATFGLPHILVSDNGAQFKSALFQNFLHGNGISHRLTAPYHPATNGQAERFVQTVKNGLKAMEGEGGDLDLKLARLLMQLRRTPSATGQSSFELMFGGRRMRTLLDVMVDGGRRNGRRQPSKARSLSPGDRVQARYYLGRREEKWKFGEVLAREGQLHYRLKMDDGSIWRRHIDQILPTKYGGEN